MILNILITNDDGDSAPGIQRLRQVLEPLGQVYLVAPDGERSATGHGITVHHPIRITPLKFEDSTTQGWAISGTPTDCVKLALEKLLPQRPDLLVSGINLGANVGTDVLYSGTVSAAIEGIIYGIPSIAISLVARSSSADFSLAAQFAAKLCRQLSQRQLTPATMLNVNVPEGKTAKGVQITRLGLRHYRNSVEERVDPRGRTYYWLAGTATDLLAEEDVDSTAVAEGYISVTPVHFDMTKYQLIEELCTWQLTVDD